MNSAHGMGGEAALEPAASRAIDGPGDRGAADRVRLWAGRGTAAFLDQLLTSGANFALSIILARQLPASEYGAYAVAFAVFLLVANLYQGALLTPSLVLGATRFAGRHPEYLAAMVRLHAVLGGVSMGALGLAALFCSLVSGQDDLAASLGAMALAAPAVLLLWLARSAWYLRLEPWPAAWGAALYAGVLLGGVLLLAENGRLTATIGILMMGLAGLLSGVWLLMGLKPDWRGRLDVRLVWAESWQLGRWEMAIALAAWLPASLCYPVTAAVLSNSQAGVLRAFQNFALPITQSVTSVLRLMQPYVTAEFSRKGATPARTVWLVALIALGGTSLYIAVVYGFQSPLLKLAYGEGRFSDAGNLLPWFIVPAMLAGGTESLAMGLRAMRGSSKLLLAYLAAGGVYILTGVSAAQAWGLAGVAATLIVANLASLLVVGVLFYRRCEQVDGVMK